MIRKLLWRKWSIVVLTMALCWLPKGAHGVEPHADYKDAAYYQVTNSLVLLTRTFNELAEETGGAGWWYGVKSLIGGFLGTNSMTKAYDQQLIWTSAAVAKAAWPLSTGMGGWNG